MQLRDFLRDKLLFIIMVLLTAGIGGFVLYALNDPPAAIIVVNVVYLSGSLAALLGEYLPKRAFYKELFSQLNDLDRKHYISEIMEAPTFYEGAALAEVLQAVGKSMNDEIGAHGRAIRDYRDYVELWVHEIKTPISAAKLICENNGYAKVSDEVDKIENYVEQALFYARSGSVEKDYVIRKTELKTLIAQLLKKNAGYLIANKVKINLQAEGMVYTDSKWLLFILQQLLDNAVKYGAQTIAFSFRDGVLTLKDDGIGIPPQDLPRVFERGFTGENGRITGKSTGMGLYLCQELCGKLGLTLSAAADEGTEIAITFPRNSYVTLV
ncbi:signal transduction histidine kinase [Desulfitobacterium dehalogenans ATCC 51507]|uniref:histidine kinase n=1 Tax=Desulfitobacterium dehalogenans (strain ATCC 51507 / DSM 9161 / JW/IU-DC1) TaxID=756499 RepID=I4A4S2_DESDJ|nr:sensor histidine kinase [Desulfitobacterium dehalogenans]AFL98956.1 signal transduction histidine kinase [Desulfitobacterium dehalogenans ATCC 51507]